MIRELLGRGVEGGAFRKDVASEELETYCLHAGTAAGNLPPKAAIRRLVSTIIAGWAAPRVLMAPRAFLSVVTARLQATPRQSKKGSLCTSTLT